MADYFIRNANVVRLDEHQNFVAAPEDVLIRQGVIQARTPTDGAAKKRPDNAETINAEGAVLVAGLTDVGVRLPKINHESLQTLADEAHAAGVTAIALLPHEDCPLDQPEQLRALKNLCTNINLDIRFIADATLAHRGEKMSELIGLLDAGADGLLLDPFPESPLFLQALARYLKSFATPTRKINLWVNPTHPAFMLQGIVHEGEIGGRLGLAGIPVLAETLPLLTLRALMPDLGEHVQAHCTALSAAQSLIHLQEFSHKPSWGVPLINLLADEQALIQENDRFNPRYRVLPPLRSQVDRQALIAAVFDRAQHATIHSQMRPHAPMPTLLPFGESPLAGGAMAQLLPATAALALAHQLPLTTWLAPLTLHPASLLGNRANMGLSLGSRANLCLFSEASAETAAHVLMTWVDGQVVFRAH